ncbi:unnamed protein product [Urochloa humidicola]
MARCRAGSTGINPREMPIATYYRALSLSPQPPPPPVPVAALVADSAPRRSASPPDIEDPPSNLPAAAAANANPARGGAPPPPFLLQGRLDDLVRRRSAPAPLGDAAAGRVLRRRRLADNNDEGRSERRASPAPAPAPAPPQEVYEALRAMPGLARGDLMRAYSKLIRDDRLFRSLTALPGDMRKDWLLMEMRNGQQ